MRRSLVVAVVLLAGCGGVLYTMHEDHTGQQLTPPSAPQATATASLTQHPTSEQLTAHLCASLATEGSLGRAAAAACRALGAAPASDDLAFQAHVDVALTSSNPVSVSVASVLLVVTAFPDSGESANVGAICITLCPDHGSECPQDPDACRSSDPAVHGESDFAHATPNFLSVPALTAPHHRELRRAIVRPHAHATLGVDLAIASEMLLGIVQRADGAATDAIRAGHAPTYAIPYAIEGAVWIDAGTSARSAATIPRVTGTWDLTSP